MRTDPSCGFGLLGLPSSLEDMALAPGCFDGLGLEED